MVEVAGVEEPSLGAQVIVVKGCCGEAGERVAQICAQIQGKDRLDLVHLVESWPSLPQHIKAAILALTGLSNVEGAKE